MLWVAGPEGEVVFLNHAWLAFRGRELQGELGGGWIEGIHEDDRTVFLEAYRAAFRQERPFTIEHRLRRADGVMRWVATSGTPWMDPDGAFLGQLGSSVDITARREHDPDDVSALQRLETLIESARNMAYRMRLFPTRAIEYAAGAVEAITGHTPEAFYADPDLPRKSLHPEDAAHLVDSLDPEHLHSTATLRWIHPDGKIVWAEHRRRPVFDGTGRVVAVEGIARDVTGLVESQRRLRDSEAQMRELAGRLQSAREEERTKLARELHDELGQTLTALKLEIGRAIAALSGARLTPNVVDRLQSLMGLSELGLATVKRIATDLRPPALDHLGLAEAIRWEALAFKARSGLRCHVRSNKASTALSAEQQTAIFRIFQEAITNVARHAHASAVTVTLIERETFELRIRDNGRGISDTQAADARAIGLIGMRERAALVGGVFQIEGRPGKGTTISVRIPLVGAAPRARPARTRKVERPSR